MRETVTHSTSVDDFTSETSQAEIERIIDNAYVSTRGTNYPFNYEGGSVVSVVAVKIASSKEESESMDISTRTNANTLLARGRARIKFEEAEDVLSSNSDTVVSSSRFTFNIRRAEGESMVIVSVSEHGTNDLASSLR